MNLHFKSSVEKIIGRRMTRIQDHSNRDYAAHLQTAYGELRVEIRAGDWFIRMRFINLEENPPLPGVTGPGVWDIGTGADGREFLEAHLRTLEKRLLMAKAKPAPVNPFDLRKLQLAADDLGDAVFLVTSPGEAHPIAEIDCNVDNPEGVAKRIASCVQACLGLDLPADVTPGVLAELVRCARDVGDSRRLDLVDPGDFVSLRESLAKLGPVSKHADEPRPTDVQIRAEYAASEDPDAVLRKYNLDSLEDLNSGPY